MENATVTCLGAAGGMGGTLATHLSQSKHIGSLILADLNGDAVRALATRLTANARCRIKSQHIDALNPAGMAGLLAKTDFLVNAAGPFFRLGVPTLRSAIQAGVPCLDICDDPQPTLEMLALDAEAKAAGVSAVVGMGASPGISNLMAKRAAERLDRVTDCFTAWSLDAESQGDMQPPIQADQPGPDVSAATVHLMEQISGTIDTVEAGHLVKRKPLEAVTLAYPGAGTGSGLTVGHPEPVTLLNNLSVTGRSANIMLMKSTTAAYLKVVAGDIDTGKITLEQGAELLMKPTLLRTAGALVRSPGIKGHGKLPVFFALLTGTKDGQFKTVGCRATTLPSGMDGVTAIPAALAVDMLLADPAPPGVHAPEAVINARELLNRLRLWCPGETADIDDFMPVTEAFVG